MAVDAPKPGAQKQGTRRASRLHVAGRLFALLGLPLMVIFGIFAGGVYLGALRSYRVQMLEAEYLGFEPPLGSPSAATPEQPKPEGTPSEPKPGEQPQAEGTDKPSDKPEPTKSEPTTPEPTTPEPTTPPTTALPTATADPVGAELRSLFDSPLHVRVKLLVDPALVVARPDWLSYAASLIDASNASFQVLFGVQVRLQGVVIWDDRPEGVDAAALLADLATREREGADVILGLVASTAPADLQPQAWTDAHGDHALVFADLRTQDRYYRNLLRTLAGLLGALPNNDAAAKQLGSFMSDAEPRDGSAPVLDPDNRGRVIINKRQPFADSRPKSEI